MSYRDDVNNGEVDVKKVSKHYHADRTIVGLGRVTSGGDFRRKMNAVSDIFDPDASGLIDDDAIVRMVKL